MTFIFRGIHTILPPSTFHNHHTMDTWQNGEPKKKNNGEGHVHEHGCTHRRVHDLRFVIRDFNRIHHCTWYECVLGIFFVKEERWQRLVIDSSRVWMEVLSGISEFTVRFEHSYIYGCFCTQPTLDQESTSDEIFRPPRHWILTPRWRQFMPPPPTIAVRATVVITTSLIHSHSQDVAFPIIYHQARNSHREDDAIPTE